MDTSGTTSAPINWGEINLPYGYLTGPLQPDLLHHGLLGPASGTRGRVIRAVFWLLRVWPVKT
jgi:hypothetical protein